MDVKVVAMKNVYIVADKIKEAIQSGDSFCCGGKVIATGLVDTALKALEALSISAIQVDEDTPDSISCKEGIS